MDPYLPLAPSSRPADRSDHDTRRRHDPSSRVLVCRLNAWEFRARACCLGDGFSRVHGLQLWHPERRVSILVPSIETRGRFQVFPIDGASMTFPDYATVREAVRRRLGLVAPVPARLLATHRWYLRLPCALLVAPFGRT